MVPPGPPALAVVVATHNRAHLLDRLVGALADQVVDAPFEVVIVDDGSTDDTWTQLQQLQAEARVPLRAIRLEQNRGPATARNAGWRSTNAPLIVFTDDDCTPDPRWLAAMVAGLADADVVQGRTLADPAQREAHGPFSRTVEVPEQSYRFETCNVGYRRTQLEGLGGFDERFRRPGGEDTDLAWRAVDAGAQTRFLPDALVLHDVRRSSFAAHLLLATRWSGVVLLVRTHPRAREQMHRRWFWKRSHPPAILAAAGLALALRPGAGLGPRLAGAALVLPYVRFRRRTWPLLGSPLQRTVALPLALAADLAEVGTMVAASARYRTLLL